MNTRGLNFLVDFVGLEASADWRENVTDDPAFVRVDIMPSLCVQFHSILHACMFSLFVRILGLRLEEIVLSGRHLEKRLLNLPPRAVLGILRFLRVLARDGDIPIDVGIHVGVFILAHRRYHIRVDGILDVEIIRHGVLDLVLFAQVTSL